MNSKAIFDLFLFQIKSHKKTFITTILLIFGIMFMYMILFSSMQELAQAKLNAMPEELLKLVGMGSFDDMSNYIKFYGMIFNLLIVVLSVYLASFTSKLVVNEEKNRTIEFLSSLELKRTDIFSSKIILSYSLALSSVLAAMIAALICGILNGGTTFNAIDLFLITKSLGTVPFLFVSISMAITAYNIKFAPLATFLPLASYLLGYLGNLMGEKLNFLLYLSPFEQLSAIKVLDDSVSDITMLGLYFVVIILSLPIGMKFYSKRDYQIG